MNPTKTVALASSVFMALQLMMPIGAQAQSKRTVAVMPFEVGSVQSEVGTAQVAKGVEALITDKLVNDGTYKVYDRQSLDAVLKEQNLSVSDRADPSTAVKVGKLGAVDALIYGTVINLGFEKHESNIGASSIGGYGLGRFGGYGGFGGGGVKTKSGKCSATIEIKFIDTTDGAILLSTTETAESSRKGANIWGGWGGQSGSVGGGASDFSSSIAGEAISGCIAKIAPKLEELAAKLPERHADGKIADVSGKSVTVTMGKAHGLAVGDNLEVDRPYKTITDPDSGAVIKELTNAVAVITVDSVEEKTASGNIVKGGGVKVGDKVKKITTDVSAVIINVPDTKSATTTTTSATGTVVKKTPAKGK